MQGRPQKVPVAPFLDDPESTEEQKQALNKKKIEAIKKSRILKSYIRAGKCNFVSDKTLQENPVSALQEAVRITPSFPLDKPTFQRCNSEPNIFSQSYLKTFPYENPGHAESPKNRLMESLIETAPIKNKKYVGMAVGTIVTGATFALIIGGLIVTIVGVVAGLVLGGLLGYHLKKNYGQLEKNMKDPVKLKWKLKILMRLFQNVGKETAILVLKKIIEVGGDPSKKDIREIVRKFVRTDKVAILLEKEMDRFDSKNDKELLETIFELFLPVLELLESEKGKKGSTYRRLSLLIQSASKKVAQVIRRVKYDKKKIIHTDKPLEVVLKEAPIEPKIEQVPKNAPPIKHYEHKAQPIPTLVQYGAGDDISASIEPSEVDQSDVPQIIVESPSIKSYKSKASTEVTNLLNIINEPTDANGWTKVVNERQIAFYKRQVPGRPVVLVKGNAILEGIPINIMWKAIADLELRKKWETIFSTMEVVDRDESESEIVYFIMKTPFGIQERDFLQKRTIVHDFPEKGQTIMHFVSIEHPMRPPVRKYIRAHTYISGYLFKEVSKFPLRCEVHIVSQTDIKGAIPKRIINMFAASRTKAWVEAFKKGCIKLMEEMRAKGLSIS